MDLYAYAQIEKINEIAQKNNIDCPRLRGYRLMKDEVPDTTYWMSENEIVYMVEDLCRSIPFWTDRSGCYECSSDTDRKVNYYIHDDGDTRSIRWDRIKGWKRKVLKTAIHNKNARIRQQTEMWNKYAGQDGILYIHARIGGNNWPWYYKEVVDQPWFIEKVDDAYDSTYCDIYARIQTDGG